MITAMPGWADADLSIEPIETGITNRNFRVDAAGGTFVVRLSGENTDLLGIDRGAEHEAASAAAAAGVGPPVEAFLPELGALVTRFVPGAHIPQADMGDAPVLEGLVRAIRAIHDGPLIRSTFPVFRIVEDYRRVAEEHDVPIPPAYEEAHALAARIEETFARAPIALVTCHNDLLNANMLRDGDHVWIVDYEYAGVGDPFFDLANLSVNNGLTPDAQESLLAAYFGEVGEHHRARLGLMRLMSDFREAMWGVVQQGLSALDVDYVAYADTHFSRLLASAGDAPIDEWCAAAAGGR